jgi:hypothetical protein
MFTAVYFPRKINWQMVNNFIQNITQTTLFFLTILYGFFVCLILYGDKCTCVRPLHYLKTLVEYNEDLKT